MTARRLPRRGLRLGGEQRSSGSSSRTATRSSMPNASSTSGAISPTAPMRSRPASSVAERVGCRPAGTCAWSMRAPMPSAAAISRHTATAAGASRPARTTPSDSYSSGRSPGAGRVHVADLEQRDAGPPVRLVERDRLEQARTQRRAQHVLVGDQRVRDVQRVRGESGRRRGRRRERNGDGITSLMPRPSSTSRSRRRRCWSGREVAVERRLRHQLAGSARSRSGGRPPRRRRSPPSQSGRHDGSATVSASRSSPDTR